MIQQPVVIKRIRFYPVPERRTKENTTAFCLDCAGFQTDLRFNLCSAVEKKMENPCLNTIWLRGRSGYLEWLKNRLVSDQ